MTARTKAICLCLAADAFLLLAMTRARRDYFVASGPFRRGVQTLIPPGGFLPDGTPYQPSADARCELLQYTSVACPHCAANWQTAEALARQSANTGCTVVSLAPAPGQLPLRQALPGEIELAYLPVLWVEQLPRLELEPTTILLGPHGRIVWYAVGELTSQDLHAAATRLRHSLASDRLHLTASH